MGDDRHIVEASDGEPPRRALNNACRATEALPARNAFAFFQNPLVHKSEPTCESRAAT
jgi:hypothetical protein